MIDAELFKKLLFTQSDKQQEKSSSWLRKFESIDSYLKNQSFKEILSHSSFSNQENEKITLRFALSFNAIKLHENQEIRTISCILHLYKQVGDLTLQSICSRETLDVLCRESTLSHADSVWLNRLMPYFFTDTHGDFSILLPVFMEVELLKILCREGRLFYFDPEPKTYYWIENTQPAVFRLQLQETDEDWKLWGKLVDVHGNVADLWDIQTVSTGGVARHDQQLFEYTPTAYPWIETLLSGGAIRCPKALLQDFLYRLLCLFDQEWIDWPINFNITSIIIPVQPIFYVKTKEDKKQFKTKIEGFAWFRSDNLEYPDEIHKNLSAPPRPKVLRVHVRHGVGHYQVSVQIPDRDAEDRRLKELETCSGLTWHESRRSFQIELANTTKNFYYLLNHGWEVWAENLQVKILQEMEIQLSTDSNWFEMNLADGKSGAKISAWQLIHLLKKKRMFIQLSDGSLGLLPEQWYQEFEQLFILRFPDISGKEEESLRFSKAHAFHFAKMAEKLENSEDVHFKSDAGFEQIREEILNINGLKPMQPAATFQFTLRHYQEIGLSWLYFLGKAHLGGCLADDMGLGKTVQVLAYLDLKKFELKKGEKFKTLLVCPRSLLEHWLQEAKKCAPRLNILILRSAEMVHLESLLEDYDLFLISYGLVRTHVQKLQPYPFDLLALDEAQLVKNQNTQITMAVNQLQGLQRLAISGTPVENHMGEFFSLFEFLNPGLTHPALLKTLGIQIQGDAEAPPMATQFLKGLRPLILRRLKTEVAKELPPKLEQVLILPMVEEQEAIYTSLKSYYQEQLKNKTVELFYDKSFFLEGLLRLRQAACHPLLFEKNTLNHQEKYSEYASNKFEFLIDKLKTLVSANHKAIVFSQFTSLLKLFKNILDTLEIPYEYLDGQSQHRMEIVTRFQESPAIPILLAGIKTGGLGLNLTAADYCFILDPWWNPAIEKQAVDRIHRIGQTKTVNIYRIVSQDTVEEKMLLLKEKKQKIADQLITADQSFLEQLNYEDFQFLFQ